MGVEPKIGGKTPPKWMVNIMENPIKILEWDDLGVPLFLETPRYCQYCDKFQTTLEIGDCKLEIGDGLKGCFSCFGGTPSSISC